ncbi:peptide chain release factor 2 [Candidatus Uhrbacteria bacterium]|nr:peptide chain release factor 2 [Candidatus Uhrbacteria bacterium]
MLVSKSLAQRSPPWGGYFDIPRLKEEASKLEGEVARPDFWRDQERARRASQRLATLKREIASWESLDHDSRELIDLAQIAEREGVTDLSRELEVKLDLLEAAANQIQIQLLFADEYDSRDAILSVHAGAGGTEAQDWAEMLLRMFFRYAERKGFTVELLDETRGTEAGIKSSTVRIRGDTAYGHLRSEHGVHRLVRISPFDSEQMRHTSFALVEVMPELDDIPEIELDPKDLRIDTFLSSGHGGQSVQTTYSAVRVVHIPSGITVACQNERSQQQNKETALKILRTKLFQKKLEEQEAEKTRLRGEHVSAAWGNQIRSYVLHPYKLVKDHRTTHATSDAAGVLDGDLDSFVEAYLRWRAATKR